MADLQILDLFLFAVRTFAVAVVTGVAGFAFGVAATAMWQQFLPPAQTDPRIWVDRTGHLNLEIAAVNKEFTPTADFSC